MILRLLLNLPSTLRRFFILRTRHLLVLTIIVAQPTLGCGLLIGSVKPVDERSDSYRVTDLSKEFPNWMRLDNREAKVDAGTDSPDVAFQSKTTASIISLNSACRLSLGGEKKDLKDFTNLLLLGITDITQRIELKTQLQGTPALDTTVEGTLNNQPIRLRSVVLRLGYCIYDLTLVARPTHFKVDEKVFSQFIASVRLK